MTDSEEMNTPGKNPSLDVLYDFLDLSNELLCLIDQNYCLIWANKEFYKASDVIFGNYLVAGDYLFSNRPNSTVANTWQKPLKSAFAGETVKLKTTVVANRSKEFFEFSLKKAQNPSGSAPVIAAVGKHVLLNPEFDQSGFVSDKMFKAFVQQSNCAMFLHDLKGKIIEVNEATSRLTGYSRTELLQMSVSDIDPDSTSRKDKEIIWDEIDTEKEIIIEVRHQRRDGSIYPAEISVSKIKFYNQDYILALARDITEKKNDEQKLKRAYSFNTSLIESMQDGCSVLDENGVQVMVNDALCSITGYSKEELIGHGMPHPYWDPQNETLLNKVFSDIKSGKANAVQIDFRHKNGRKIPVILSPFVVEGTFENNSHFAATIKDISDLKNYENILHIRLQLAELKDQLSLDDFLTAALDKMELATGSKIGFFHFFETDNKAIKLQSWSSSTKENFCRATGVGLHYPIQKAGVWADCVRTKKPVVHNDFEAVENKKGWPEGHAMVHRQLTIPVIRNQQVVAVCGVGNKVFEYDQLDLENAQLLADLIWELAESIVTREQLTESEKQLRGLVENAPYGIYRTTADGVILMANPYLLKMLEFDSTDELYKRNLQAEGIFDKHHRELFLSKLMREGVVQNMESRWVTKSGKSIVVSESARLVKNNKGEVLYFEGMVENLSHLKRLTLSLKKSERETKALLALIPDLLFRMDQNAVFLDYAGASSELYYQRKDFIGKKAEEVLPNDIAVLIKEKIHLTLSEKTLQTFHYQLEVPGKGRQYYEARMVVYDANEVLAIVRNETEHIKAQQTILDNLANLRGIMEATDDVLLLLEADGTIIESNEEHAKRFNLSRDQIIGKNAFDLLDKDTAKCRRALLNEAVTFGKSVINEDFRAGIYNETRIFPVSSGGAPVSRVAVFSRNITEQKKLQEALLASESRYRTLFENLSQGVFFQSADGKVIEANEAALYLFGLTRDQFLGKDSFDDRWKVVDEHYNEVPPEEHTSMKALLSGKAVVNELVGVWLPEKNKYNWMIANAIPQFKAGDQKPCQVFVSLQDINERRHFEEALHKSEERFALVVDASELGIWDWNVQTGETYFSKQWKNQLGFRDDEIENKFESWVELLHPKDRAICVKAVEDYLKKPCEHFIMEFRLKHKNGSYRWIYNKASSQKDEKGKVIRMFGAHTDITARKLAEKELEDKNSELESLNAQKDKFFSIIAHDLKSPFNSIMGFSEHLVDQIKEKDYEGIEKYAGIIFQSSSKAVNLLTNLLDWARSQTGRLVYNPEYIELVSLVREQVELLDETAHQKGIVIESRMPHNLPVLADPSMIRTVLRNLISNAIKFTNEGGRIEILASTDKGRVHLSVSDTGVGIPADKIPLLFKIDESYSTKGTAKETGTGLGLILCKEFIEKHDGSLSVQSTEGKGSTFSFSIPND